MINQEEEVELEQIINYAFDYVGYLTAWEEKFIRDIREKYEKYETTIRLSEKQWDVLREIYIKIELEANK